MIEFPRSCLHANRHRIPRHARPAPSLRGARGLTLIEILVTMVLLGVGLLGLAGLQLRGMQVNQGSTFRSQAAMLAEDLADRMRADAATAAAHGYDGQYTPSATTAANAAVAPLVADWQYRLQSLPSGCAVVNTNNPAQPLETVITVTWDDTRAIRSAAGTAAAANPPCTVGQGNGSYVLTTE